MKLHLTLLALASALCLPACQSTEGLDKERLARIGNVALTVAESSGKITPEEAALARQAGMILLDQPEGPATVALPAVEATASK